ncbi:uncharacterized protein [Apostichopus japonicus]|uniref:uncharacterized protein isoform X3 n=1 Tax=Stichopus japonicus TaxID=307972 RepID=UPI003AB14C0C
MVIRAFRMNRPGFDRSATAACLHGSSAGMISLPDSFQRILTDDPHISPSDIDSYSVSQFHEQHVLHQGFIYKRAADKKTDIVTQSVGGVLPVKLQFLNKWQLRYVVIYGHYVVYYKDDTNKRPVGKFSLKDYNRVVRAEEMLSADRKWPFKVIGMRSTARTWYFCAASEREMKLWMACFKLTMDHAIHGKVKQTCLDIITTEQARCPPVGMARDDSITSASSTGSGGDRTFQDDETYEDLESPTTDMENDENYDDIAHEEEDDDSGHSGGSSGGRIHPPLSVAQSDFFPKASNFIYEIQSVNLRKESARPDSYFASGCEYLDIIPDVEDSEDNYDRTDHDAPIRLPPPPPPGRHPQEAAKPDMANVIQTLQRGHRTRQSETESIHEDKLSRPAPDGNSFRGNKFVERTKPPPIATPRPPPKPITKPKPNDIKPMTLPKATKPQVPVKAKRNLLPESAVLKISDKVYSESLLRKHNLNGMYLLRGSARDITKQVIMVWDEQADKSKHYTIFGDQSSSFALDQTAQFASLDELVQYYLVNFLPNTNLKLTKPCPG